MARNFIDLHGLRMSQIPMGYPSNWHTRGTAGCGDFQGPVDRYGLWDDQKNCCSLNPEFFLADFC
jgi:hypothetical protein